MYSVMRTTVGGRRLLATYCMYMGGYIYTVIWIQQMLISMMELHRRYGV